MQGVQIRNDLFSASDVKCVTVNNFSPPAPQKNFINSLQNVRNTLGCLERSINKSKKYEQKLLQCKGTHSHTHDVNQWWDSDQSEDLSYKCSTNATSTSNSKSSNTQDEVTETWSTMSIVCLQYQYEELAKRYKALLQAYDEQCNAVGQRDKNLEQLREHADITITHLTNAHNALLTIGEKYMVLKDKRIKQKSRYEDELDRMKQTLHDVLKVASCARMQFDERLAQYMENERHSDGALLLYEIRKCNLLFLENMRLKALIEEIQPGHVEWTKS